MHLETLDGENIFAIHDLLSPQECAQLIARSEAIGYEVAGLNGELVPEVRNNGRALLEDAELAADLWRRIEPLVPPGRDTWQVCGLHERFRFYRYETAEQFKPHYDGSVRRGDAERSKLTFMVYLCDVAEGGATIFYARGLVPRFEVRPECGKALLFEHQQLHEGAPVVKGCKYVLRTDVMYRPTAATSGNTQE
jgi:predicted 2-oxoglutarate/Fe(II)-dependent dioxygenase YbiX